MSKHTPGPWYTVPMDQHHVEICDNDADHDRAILAVVFPAGDDSESQSQYGTRDANSSLIAAAPDLLEAARMIVRRMEGCNCASVKAVVGEGGRCDYCQVRDAIKKAEGGEP